jgi:acetyl-CoA carboxylase biotin carboxyl carrier protein
MNLDQVKEFINLAKEEGVSELKYEADDVKIAVSFNSSTAPINYPAHAQVAKQIINASESQTLDKLNNDPSLVSVTSPFVGTFYVSSSPDKDAYVSIGTKVSKGSTLCILEAMKIMNEIESEVSGEIVEICVENESLVEFGQPLFKIRV